MNNPLHYDSNEVRECAKRLEIVAFGLRNALILANRTIQNDIYPDFCGKAANSLHDVIESYKTDGDKLSTAIEDIVKALRAKANAMDIADLNIGKIIANSK